MPHTEDKISRYETASEQIRSLIEGENDETAVLANVSAALHEAFPERFFWTGFYRVRGNELLLGPFQGTVACSRIPYGRGVCGTAWAEGRTLVVPDVEAFAGHIACSSLSRSEIVVPIHDGKGDIRGVLDIDSRQLAAFDDTDRHYLEHIADIIHQIYT